MKPTPNDLEPDDYAKIASIAVLLGLLPADRSWSIAVALIGAGIAYLGLSIWRKKEKEQNADKTFRKLALQVHNYIQTRRSAAINRGLVPPSPESIYNDIKVDGFTYKDYLKYRPQ